MRFRINMTNLERHPELFTIFPLSLFSQPSGIPAVARHFKQDMPSFIDRLVTELDDERFIDDRDDVEIFIQSSDLDDIPSTNSTETVNRCYAKRNENEAVRDR